MLDPSDFKLTPRILDEEEVDSKTDAIDPRGTEESHEEPALQNLVYESTAQSWQRRNRKKKKDFWKFYTFFSKFKTLELGVNSFVSAGDTRPEKIFIFPAMVIYISNLSIRWSETGVPL